MDCHAGDGSEAGLDLAELAWDFKSPEPHSRWVQVFDRIQAGEMPPPNYGTLEDESKRAFTEQLAWQLTNAHEQSKGTVLRRLNRREYENTLNDLFGTNLQLAELLPEDGKSHEFDTVGKTLGMSTVQMQRYLASIQLCLETAIAKSVKEPQPTLKKVSYADTREGEKFIGEKWLQLDDGAVVFFQDWGYPTGMLRNANTHAAGRYRIRVTGYAYQSDEPITFALGATTFARGLERPTFGYYSVNPLESGQPTVVETEVWIEDRYMLEITPQKIFDNQYFIKKNGLDAYEGPGLAILSVELEGPLVDEHPSRGHRLIFDGIHRREIEPSNPAQKTKSWYVPQFEISSANPIADAQQALLRTLQAASRRPVTEVDVQPFVALFEAEYERDQDFEDALKTAISAIFCSPDFLYFGESPGWLDDYALASRLSYFLTRTTPDAQLLNAAADGGLTRDPDLLAAEVDRLLADPRSERFIVDFCDAWLDLREIEFTSPDTSLYPEFDPYLQYSMLQESRSFFRKLIAENLPVRNLVTSDFAMLNERLAEHYSIAGVDGPHVRSVKLPKGSLRGGVLGQAAVLKVSANGTNTSPVVRGVWVMERLLGQPPSPPPPGVPGVEPDTRGALTLREILDRHRSMDQCNSCHRLIDPPGFALECFNPIGGYREKFRKMGEGEKVDLQIRGRRVQYKLGLPVDASGKLADGSPFEGYLQFRSLLAKDQRTLSRALASKLLVFASGRELGFSDRPIVESIVNDSEKSGFGVRDLIQLVVRSEIFKRK